ncbi:MAG: hypothetical protein NC432_04480 [Roseburia sp.]|nr:hypothetical protein [Roseburia sp.]MCM1097000.1 hypothetical protein [Ruminococcus flavefaciens]
MKLSYYMRGLGTGIVVTALIMGIAMGNAKPAALTDAEIKAAAEKLGMVDRSSLKLSDLASPEDGENEGTPDGAAGSGNDGNGEAPDGTPDESGDRTREPGTDDETEVGSAKNDETSDGTPDGSGKPGDETSEPGEGDGTEAGSAENDETSDETPDGSGEPGDETSEPGEGDGTEAGSAENVETLSGAQEPEAGGGTGNAGTPGGASDPEENGNDEAPEGTAEPDGSENNGGSSPTETYTVTVTRGSGSRAVCRQLEEQGLIEDAGAFDQYLIDNGYSKRISVGTYEIEAGADWERIAKIITKSR